jgi:hypothetical protein
MENLSEISSLLHKCITIPSINQTDESTSYYNVDDDHIYCLYCNKEIIPNHEEEWIISCDCQGAEKEKEYRKDITNLRNKIGQVKQLLLSDLFIHDKSLDFIKERLKEKNLEAIQAYKKTNEDLDSILSFEITQEEINQLEGNK